MPTSRLTAVLLGFLVALMAAGKEMTRPGQMLHPLLPRPTPTYAYQNDSVRIEIFRRDEIPHVVYYTVEIWTSGPQHILSAFSGDRFDGTRERVPDIAERYDAIVAINADYATYNDGGIIIRNGELYRANGSSRAMLVMDRDGNFIAHERQPADHKETAAQLIEEAAWHTFLFGPVLVDGGEPVPLPERFFINTKGAREPRTAIGQLGPNHYLWIVVDGRREGHSRGVTLAELQELFLLYGAQTAFNLDGGGSTTLYFDGEVINRPANASLRRVPDILYIGR